MTPSTTTQNNDNNKLLYINARGGAKESSPKTNAPAGAVSKVEGRRKIKHKKWVTLHISFCDRKEFYVNLVGGGTLPGGEFKEGVCDISLPHRALTFSLSHPSFSK